MDKVGTVLLMVAVVALASVRGATLRCAVQVCSGSESPSIGGWVTVEDKTGNTAEVTASLTGLARYSVHGFHIHSDTIDGIDCSTASGHYNPDSVDHTCPENVTLPRHVGDLGNVYADYNGNVYSVKTFDNLSTNDIYLRTIVIHQDPDDCYSQTSGDAGTRAGFCLLVNPASSILISATSLFLVVLSSMFTL
mmetsp:Transcript_33747/g.94981  ORF Transcript_33747/g.94981 Transcript_33747/m.94981 type:complete len:193 (-) Transcript_33747:131-709(-)